MRITQNVCVNQNSNIAANNRYAGYSHGIKQDTFTPTFKGLKKTCFEGIDFAAIEKFKAPIEKFKTKQDLQDWAWNKYRELCKKNYGGKNIDISYQRKAQIDTWDKELSKNPDYTNVEKYIIMDGVTKYLKPNEKTLCPIFNKEILDNTLNELKEKLKTDKKYQFKFGRMYKTNLREMYAKGNEADATSTKWIVIPSKTNDPENFEENLKKLQTLSCHEWCTKHGGAQLYLRDGDIHIYLEKGEPKLAIRFDEDIITEINGEMNDRIIPSKYYDIMDSYIKEHDFLTTSRVEDDLNNSKRMIENVKQGQIKVEKEQKKNNGFLGFIKNLFK